MFWKKKSTPKSEVAEASTIPNHPSGASKSGAERDRVLSEGSPTEEKKNWLGRLRAALAKTKSILRTDIRDLWKTEGRLVDEAFLQELFAILVKTDMGPQVASQIRDRIGSEFRARKVEMSDVLAVVREEIRQTLQSGREHLKMSERGPTVILVVGVNGSGKTTSIAKLAHRFQREGKRVILGAGDTFRAAAVQQLKIWSERIGCAIVLGEQGGDPGTVAFKATARARDEQFDVCILDTAGRLQTQANLMQQLEKIRRVIAKQIEGAPHEVLLVLDATAGQNALSQAKGFSEAAGCTGIVLAKLDGTAKGGVVIPIQREFGLPVKLVGLGEQLDDLDTFDPDDFTQALFGE